MSRVSRPLAEHRRIGGGRVIEIGVLVVFFSPVLWGLSALLDAPGWLVRTFMWLSIFMGAVLLASMVAAPFLTRSQRRAWAAFTPADGYDHSHSGDDLLAVVREVNQHPFDARQHLKREKIRDVVRTRARSVPAVTFAYLRRDEGGTEMDYQVLMLRLPTTLPYLGVDVPMELAAGVPRLGVPVNIEHGEFNERYRIRTYDRSIEARKYAVDVLHPRAVELLMSLPPIEFSIQGDWLLHASMPARSPEQAIELLETYGAAFAELIELIPRHVLATHGR